MIAKILVPTDGSKTAQKAASHAVELAKQLKAELFVIAVVDERSLSMLQIMPESVLNVLSVPGNAGYSLESIENHLHNDAEKHVAKIIKLCKKNKVRSKAIITIGHPVEKIISEAKRLKVNFIVMGSRGVSALEAVVLGSVTYGVIHNKNTKIPVMVVK